MKENETLDDLREKRDTVELDILNMMIDELTAQKRQLLIINKQLQDEIDILKYKRKET